MLLTSVRLALTALAIPAVLAQQSVYGQCGGIGWNAPNPTTCVAGSTCVVVNPYYYQCLPGTASSSSTSSLCTTTITISSRSTTSTTFLSTPPPSSTMPTKTTTAPSTTSKISSGGSGPGTTLQSGYYWIRAVEAPNFHQYLATKPQYTTGTALLANYTAAGQFQIVDGQLVELISSSASNPTLLYANVGQPATPSSSLLPVTFATTKNTFGTFSFGGDALQWSAPTVSRQNLAAWYVCAGQQVFINTGAYLYGTPAGCADETIHYYNGATAVS